MAAGTASPEDKIVQSAVVRVVHAIYEEEFHSNTRLMRFQPGAMADS